MSIEDSAILATRADRHLFVVDDPGAVGRFFCMTWMSADLVEQRGLPLERMARYVFFRFAGIGLVAPIAGMGAQIPAA